MNGGLLLFLSLSSPSHPSGEKKNAHYSSGGRRKKSHSHTRERRDVREKRASPRTAVIDISTTVRVWVVVEEEEEE